MPKMTFVFEYDNDKDNGLFAKIWFLMEYVWDYTIG